MIKCRHSSHLFLSFIAYLTILVADDRLFTANCCFKLVFVATKVAHRAMTDMLSKGRERERDWWWWCASVVNSTPEGKIQREKEETRTNLETRLSVSLAKKKASSSFFTFCRHRSRRRYEKKKRHAERTNLYVYLRVCFLLKLRRMMSF